MPKVLTKLIGLNGVRNGLNALEQQWATDKTWECVAAADYSSHIEFGTWKMDAQPFMRPAVDNARGQIRAFSRRTSSIDQLLYLLAIDIRDYARRIAAVDTGYMRDNIVVSQG